MVVSIARRTLFVLLILMTGLAVVATDVDPGFAQPRQQKSKQRAGLFERLFGPREIIGPPPSERLKIFRRSPSKSKKTRPARKAAPESQVQTIAIAAKDANARKILVIGDYVADGIAWGLDQALAGETKLAVVNRTNGSSGLVRPDFYDWNKELLGILNAENPDVVVVALGTNDRQQIRTGNTRIATRSEEWEKIYNERIDGMVETLKVYGRPFFWVSAPPMRTAAASADMSYFNNLYRARVDATGGHFVDVWNGFTNANGQYIATGPDIDGQVRALRASDGMTFTRAGKLKLSYYVEREIRRQTGFGAGAIDLLASTSTTSTIEIGPDGKKRLVGPVISLSDPLPGASEALVGDSDVVMTEPVFGRSWVVEAPVTEPATDSALYRLVTRGDPLPGAVGRVDDFAWPPADRRSQTFLTPETAPETVGAATAEPTADAGEAVLTPVSKAN